VFDIFDIYLIEALINGVLLGGVLALLALGLNLIFGVIDVVWICYAELIMLGMYGMFFLGALYLRLVQGYSPLRIGLAFLPVAVTMGTLSIRFVLPIMGAIYDTKKIEVAGGDAAFSHHHDGCEVEQQKEDRHQQRAGGQSATADLGEQNRDCRKADRAGEHQDLHPPDPALPPGQQRREDGKDRRVGSRRDRGEDLQPERVGLGPGCELHPAAQRGECE